MNYLLYAYDYDKRRLICINFQNPINYTLFNDSEVLNTL